MGGPYHDILIWALIWNNMKDTTFSLNILSAKNYCLPFKDLQFLEHCHRAGATEVFTKQIQEEGTMFTV